jgi:hypothetical protein
VVYVNIISDADDVVTFSATKSELARLSKLLDWIIDNKSVMDEANILVPENEIIPSVHKWIDFIDPVL